MNSVGAIDSDVVPWPTLFTGMMFNNLYFWCTNQMIIQKAFSAKNLGEAQKGSLIVGVFKIVAALFLVFPGIVSRNIFGDIFMSNPDQAYPALVTAVLPQWLYGAFAAMIFGAILSSFAGALNSVATLFSLDFYKPIINKEANDRQVVRMGKLMTAVVGVIAIIVAPLIAFAPAGLYQFTQEVYGIYSMPLLVIVLFAFFSKKATARGAKLTIAIHVVLYTLSKIFLADVHFLYVLSILFGLDVLIMLAVSKLNPEGEFLMDSIKSHEKLVGVEAYKHCWRTNYYHSYSDIHYVFSAWICSLEKKYWTNCFVSVLKRIIILRLFFNREYRFRVHFSIKLRIKYDLLIIE